MKKILQKGWLIRGIPRFLLAFVMLGAMILPLLRITPVFADSVDLYWVGGTGNWSDTTHWSTSSGGSGGHAVPGSTNSTFFDGLSFSGAGQVVTVDATANCASMTWTGATNSPTIAGASTLNVYGNLTTILAMTWSHTGSLGFRATSGTNLITTNGLYFQANIVFNGIGGTWQLQDNFSSSNNWTLTNGVFDPNGYTVILPNTTHVITGAFSFYDLTRTCLTNGDSLTLASNITVTHNLTLTPASASARLIVKSDIIGTPRTIISANNIISTGVLFQDIVGAGAASWDLSAIQSGDCLGNTGITFATPAPQAFAYGGVDYKWSTAGNWTSRVPLPQDNATVDTTGITVIIDMARIGANVTFSGTGTVSLSNDCYLFGNLSIGTGLTWTYNVKYIFCCGRSASHTIVLGGKLVLVGFNAPGGTYTYQNNETGVSLQLINYGTVVYGALTHIFRTVSASAAGGTRIIDISNSDISLIWSLGGSLWSVTNNGSVTLLSSGSTITYNNTSTNAYTFAGGNLTYNNVVIKGTGNYATTISGSNSFTNLSVDRTQANKSLLFTDGTTQTIGDFSCATSDTRTVTLNGTSTAGWNIIKTGGGVTGADYLSVDYSNASPANTFYASTNSTDGGHNTGWTFTDAAGTVTTNAASAIGIDKDGLATVTLNGSYATRGVPLVASVYFDWGSTVAYGNSTTPATLSATGNFNSVLNTTLSIGTYHFRANIVNGLITTNGTDQTFTIIAPIIVTKPAASLSMTKDGVTSGNFVYEITSMGSASSVYCRVDWGLTAGYGNSTADVTRTTTGIYSVAIPSTLTPGGTYHFEGVARIGTDEVKGGDKSFTLTMPSFTTQNASVSSTIPPIATLNAQITDIGVCSSYYLGWQYGGISYGTNTTLATKTSTGDYNATLPVIDAANTYHCRAVITVGAVTIYGEDKTFLIPPLIGNFAGVESVILILPVLAAIGLMGTGAWIYRQRGSYNFRPANIAIAICAIVCLLAFIFVIQYAIGNMLIQVR